MDTNRKTGNTKKELYFTFYSSCYSSAHCSVIFLLIFKFINDVTLDVLDVQIRTEFLVYSTPECTNDQSLISQQ